MLRIGIVGKFEEMHRKFDNLWHQSKIFIMGVCISFPFLRAIEI